VFRKDGQGAWMRLVRLFLLGRPSEAGAKNEGAQREKRAKTHT
jgi:hypothetical protein